MRIEIASSVALYLGTAAAAAGFVWGVFDKLEGVLSKHSKQSLHRWLVNYQGKAVTVRWSVILTQLFDSLFGKKHLSFRCFFRSSIASLIVIFFLLLVTISRNPQLLGFITSTVKAGMHTRVKWLYVSWFLATLIPDYISLLKTRLLLAWMRKVPGKFTVLLLLLDFILTTVVARFSVALVFSMAVLLNVNLKPETTGFMKVAGRMWREFLQGILSPLSFPPISSGMSDTHIFVSVAPWFYATYATSVWVWLYVSAGLLVKGGKALDVTSNWFRSVLDIEGQPVRSIGVVASLLTFILFIVSAPFIW